MSSLQSFEAVPENKVAKSVGVGGDKVGAVGDQALNGTRGVEPLASQVVSLK